MRDDRGRVLYVGKAQSLRNRVRQYWQTSRGAAQAPLRIEQAIERVADVEYTLTDSVSEALLLEATLIKRHQPRFNVRLKDDKSYPFIKVTLGDDFPRIERTRKLPNDGSRYFGPYASATQRRRGDEPHPPPVPVPDLHDRDQGRPARAAAAVPAVPHQALPGPVHRGHLEGRLPRRHRPGDALPRGPPGAGRAGLREDMQAASDATDYERAAALRDKLRAIERTMEVQKMAAFARAEMDVLGYARPGQRGGRPALRHPRRHDRRARRLPARERRRRGRTRRRCPRSSSSTTRPQRSIPPRVLRSAAAYRIADELIAFLEARRGRPGRDHVPQRGEGRALMDLAGAQRRRDARARAGALAGRRGQDARRARRACRRAGSAGAAAAHRVLRHLAPSRARTPSAAWSSSRRAGRAAASTAASGSRHGRRATGRLRRRTARCCGGASSRALEAEEGVAEELRWRLPDLVVIDGGLGQVNVAREVLDSLGLHDMPLIGLAKEREEMFLPGLSQPLVLPANSQALYLRPAPARRGAPFRDHLPPPAARQGADEVGARRPARASVRHASAPCCGCSDRRGRCKRGDGRRDRGRARASAAALAERSRRLTLTR